MSGVRCVTMRKSRNASIRWTLFSSTNRDLRSMSFVRGDVYFLGFHFSAAFSSMSSRLTVVRFGGSGHQHWRSTFQKSRFPAMSNPPTGDALRHHHVLTPLSVSATKNDANKMPESTGRDRRSNSNLIVWWFASFYHGHIHRVVGPPKKNIEF